jgi:membrane-associated phospholipid phosphatase
MTAIVAAGRRHLPRGWLDLGRQLAIWFGFLALYQVARGVADRNPTRAFENGLGVINIEERVGDLFEVTLANLIAGSHFLTFIVSWTYWNSEFTVVGLTLLFVYLRRYTYFHRFRNWILLAANPYAAMPSLHAADALIVGLSMFVVCRRWWSKTIWLLWPAWVWFAVMATGNHFWLDILAGIVVAAIAGVVIYRKPLWRRLRPAAAPAPA